MKNKEVNPSLEGRLYPITETEEKSMGINSILSTTKTYDTKNAGKAKDAKSKQETAKSDQTGNTSAVVYEKSEQTPDTSNAKVYKRDDATIQRLKQDAEDRTKSLRDLVEKMMLKQGQKFDESTDIYKVLREGKLEVDPEISAQAQKDIAEDGYWGIEQTSDRLVSFAKALSGGDPSKAELMINAVKKGLEEATKAWGDELPDICKKTVDVTISKLEAWRDNISKDDDSATDTEKVTDKDK